MSLPLGAPSGESAIPYPSPVRAWWMVAVLCFAGFISYMHRLILSVLVDPLSADLGFGDARISLLQGAAFAIIYVFAGLPLGRLADRANRRIVLLIGASVWSLGTVSCGFAGGFGSLFAARIIVGIGEAALAPAAASMIADYIPPAQRGTAFGIFFMGMFIGGPAATGIGGPLLEAAQAGVFAHWPIIGGLAPWRVVLILAGAVGFVLPLLFLTLREPVRRGTAAALPLKQVINWAASAKWLIGPLLLAIALFSVGDYGLLSWAPTTLVRRFAWSPGQVGQVFGAITIAAGIAGSLLGGMASDAVARRHGERARLTLMIGAGVVGMIGAALVAAGRADMVLCGIGLWTFASAFGATSGIAAFQNIVPQAMRGMGMSLIAFCNTLLGLGCGPTAVALVTGLYGRPDAVGLAIASVVVPAAFISVGLTLQARRRLSVR